MIGGEAVTTKLKVFGVTWLRIKPMISCTLGEIATLRPLRQQEICQHVSGLKTYFHALTSFLMVIYISVKPEILKWEIFLKADLPRFVFMTCFMLSNRPPLNLIPISLGQFLVSYPPLKDDTQCFPILQ